MSAKAAASIERRGRCLCGVVQFVTRGAPLWVAHCHCESCRRATSAAMATYAGFAVTQVSWSGLSRARYQSSPGAERTFCPRCGSPVSFAGKRWPGEIHLFVPSFEHPETLTPQVHVHAAEQLSWLHLADGLPRFPTSPRDGPALAPELPESS